MKKIVLLFCLLFQFCIPVLAEYEPIPKHLSKQYKAEMEQIINKEYPKIINNVDDCVKRAKFLRDKIIKYGFNRNDYISLALIPETNIPTTDLYLYEEMLKVTHEKYLEQKFTPIGTDYTHIINDILTPYFRDNKVNRNKLTKIINYQAQKIDIVEKYFDEVKRFNPI